MILYFDIDGTLFSNHTPRMPPSAIRAIEMARQKGHLCFVNSGRTRAGVQKELGSLPFDGFVLGCGSRILYHGETIFARSFSPETGSRIMDNGENTAI